MMTRKEMLEWAEQTVAHIFHKKPNTIHTTTWWIARDSGGDLYLYQDKPSRSVTGIFVVTGRCGYEGLPIDDDMVKVPRELFQEVTWENSPQEIEITLKLK